MPISDAMTIQCGIAIGTNVANATVKVQSDGTFSEYTPYSSVSYEVHGGYRRDVVASIVICDEALITTLGTGLTEVKDTGSNFTETYTKTPPYDWAPGSNVNCAADGTGFLLSARVVVPPYRFNIDGYNKSINVTGTGCTVSPTYGTRYGPGSPITITATPDPGYVITSATVDGIDVLTQILAGGYEVSVLNNDISGSIVAEATYKNITVTTTGRVGATATVTVNGSPATTYEDGDTIQIVWSPPTPAFDYWKFDGQSSSGNTNPLTWTGGQAGGEDPIPTGFVDYVVVGHFIENYTVTMSSEGKGTGVSSVDSFLEGDSITFTGTPQTGNEFIHWVITVKSGTTYVTDNPYAFSGPAFDVVVTAVFTDKTYTFCSVDTDCPTGYICHNGICIPEIPTQANIPPLFEIVGGRCVPNQHATDDNDCPPGHVCVDGVCVLEVVKPDLDIIVPAGYTVCQDTIMKKDPLVNTPSEAETTEDYPASIEED